MKFAVIGRLQQSKVKQRFQFNTVLLVHIPISIPRDIVFMLSYYNPFLHYPSVEVPWLHSLCAHLWIEGWRFEPWSGEMNGTTNRQLTLSSWARHLTLTVPLSTWCMYKWVPINLMLRVTLWCTSIPSRESRNLLVISCYRNWEKLQPDGQLGLYAGM